MGMFQHARRATFVGLLIASLAPMAVAEPPQGLKLRERAMHIHVRAQQGLGVLVPMYVYPSNVHTNDSFNRLIDIKRQYPKVPFWVIVNPASGPGKKVDANYTKAIDRLLGAGCVVVGYVTTSYARRPINEVQTDIDHWRRLYPRVQGIFFDEMVYEDTEAGAHHQAALNAYARDAGFWPTIANPGTDTPGRYFHAETEAADVIIVHESDQWPSEEKLHGNYFGGYSDHPPFTRGILMYSQPELDVTRLAMAERYVGWIYVTEDEYRPKDPQAPNPWDTLSRHLEALCRQLND